MNPASFAVSDDIVSFIGPNGTVANAITASWPNAHTLELSFQPPLGAAGAYELVIGPQILDAQGNALDQDHDLIPGEVPDDQYVAAFTLGYCGSLSTDARWSPDYGPILVTCPIIIPAGLVLTIEQGTVVKFQGNSDIQVSGSLIVTGSPQQPVIFTSLKDDTAGGDTNGDGAATAPAPGDWAGMVLNSSTARATLENAQIRYADTAMNITVADPDAVVRLSGCTLRNARRGVIMNGTGMTVRIENCLMTSNSYNGLSAMGNSEMIVRSCTIGGNGLSGSGSSRAGVHLADSKLTLANTIVAFNRDGLYTTADPRLLSIQHCDFWTPGGRQIVWNSFGSPPRLDQNGNITADPLFVDRANGNYELAAASPAIDAATGVYAPGTDMLGRPRHDDLGMANVGKGYPSYVDMGAFERQANTERHDLAVLSVSDPAPAVIDLGGTITVEWTVTNAGLVASTGTWQDAVYLSDDPYLGGDVQLAMVQRTGPLNPGESYTATWTGAVPAQVSGPKYVLVYTNSARTLLESMETNNVGVADNVLSVSVPLLELGVPAVGTIAAGKWSYYRFEGQPGRTVLFSLDAASGACQLYLRRDLPPTLSLYDAAGVAPNSPDQAARLLEPLTATYYIGLYAQQIPGGSTSYTLFAQLTELDVRDVSPNRVGNAGRATLKVVGDNFHPDSMVQLVSSDGTVRIPSEVYYENAATLYATFDLASANAQPGNYNVVVTVPGPETAMWDDTVIVEAGGTANFTTDIVLPGATRPGRVTEIRVVYRNEGLVDATRPFILLDGGVPDLEWQLPGQDDWTIGPVVRFRAPSGEAGGTALRPSQEDSIVVKVRFPPTLQDVHIKVFSVGEGPADAWARISGIVIGVDDQQPLASALICARQLDGDGTIVRAAESAADGQFAIEWLPFGTYDVYVEGYAMDESAVCTVARGQDVSGLLLMVAPVLEEPPHPEPIPDDSRPSLAVDHSGMTHIVWQRNGELWHALFDGTIWTDAAPIPGAIGDSATLQASADMIDGADPGMTVVWRLGQGNDSEIMYAVGRPTDQGKWEWSTPQQITSDVVSDDSPASVLTTSGELLVVYQKYDETFDDDTDLYFDMRVIRSEDIAWIGHSLAGSSAEMTQSPAADGMDSKCLSFGGGFGFRRKFDIPILGKNWVELSSNLTGEACCDEASASGGVSVDVDLCDTISGSGSGNARATWSVDPSSNKYIFRSGSASLDFTITRQIVPKWLRLRIPYASGRKGLMDIEVGFTITGGGGGTLEWSRGNFPGCPDGGDVHVLFGIGGFGKASFFLDRVQGRVDLTGNANITVHPEFNYDVTLTFKYYARVSYYRSISGEFTIKLLEGRAARVALEVPDITIEYSPMLGTGNNYGPNSVVSDLSQDYGNDASPSLAVGPGGQIMLVWLKDIAALTGQEGNQVMVSEFSAGAWTEPVAVPNSLGMGAGAASAFDANGNLLVAWCRADSSGLTPSTPPDEVMELMQAKDITYSVWSYAGWTTPQVLSDFPGTDGSPAMATAPDGRLALAWMNHDEHAQRLIASFWDEVAWTVPQAIDSGESIGAPALGVAGGRTVCFWTSNVSSDPDQPQWTILYSVFDGTWSAPQPFAPKSLQPLVARSVIGPTRETATPNAPSSGFSLPPVPEWCRDDEDPEGEGTIPVVRPRDPEDKFGPSGYDPPNTVAGSERRFIRGGHTMVYRVEFWNDPNASVAAQDAVIQDILDLGMVDLSTFQFTRYGFLKWDVPAGGQAIDTRVDMRPEMNLAVNVKGTFDAASGEVLWWFHCIDPMTGDYPADVTAGFLPPFNPDTGFELGYVEFEVRLKDGLPTGTVIPNRAWGEFDFMSDINEHKNPAPKDGPWINTVDAGAPDSHVLPIAEAAGIDKVDVEVKWDGSDDAGGSGIRGFDVFVSKDGGPSILWLSNTPDKHATYSCDAGHSYGFHTVARDNVGNMEVPPAGSDAVVLVRHTGDVNGDLCVNIVDLIEARGNLGKQGTGLVWDVNSDGKVNVLDLIKIRNAMGQGAGCH